jgi:hypothetical protein
MQAGRAGGCRVPSTRFESRASTRWRGTVTCHPFPLARNGQILTHSEHAGCVTAGQNQPPAESDVQVRVRPLSGLSRRRQSLSRNESALLAHSRRMAGRHGRIKRRRTIKTTPLVRHAMVHLARNPPPLTRLLGLVADCGLHQLRSNSWTAEAKRGDAEDAEDFADLKNRAGGWGSTSGHPTSRRLPPRAPHLGVAIEFILRHRS